MSAAQFAHGARGAAHAIGAAAVSYVVLSLPEPARVLASHGLPAWAAYAACMTDRLNAVVKALRSR
jgi:hypothetical protein